MEVQEVKEIKHTLYNEIQYSYNEITVRERRKTYFIIYFRIIFTLELYYRTYYHIEIG